MSWPSLSIKNLTPRLHIFFHLCRRSYLQLLTSFPCFKTTLSLYTPQTSYFFDRLSHTCHHHNMASTTPQRTRPNIIITGTPGVGKTTHCTSLAESTGLTHLSINDIVKTRECHEGYDDELQCFIVDEDKLLDSIEEEVKAGGYIIDWHACEVFPKSWIDLVVVLRVGSETLFDRLKER